MKIPERWHHTEKFIQAQKAMNPYWKCYCIACENIRAIQADARQDLIQAFNQFPQFEPQDGKQKVYNTFTMNGEKWRYWLNKIWGPAQRAENQDKLKPQT